MAAAASSSGMPKAKALYGTLPEQLSDEASFASSLKRILAVRSRYAIDTAYQIDIPEPDHKEVLIMVHRKTADGPIQATVLNFSGKKLRTSVSSSHFPIGALVIDMFSTQEVGTVGRKHQIMVTLGAYEGASLLITSGS